MTFRRFAIAALAFIAVIAHAQSSPYIVTIAGDTPTAGFVTLRDAINAVNGACSLAAPAPITFAIPGTGPFTIQPTTPLPTLSCTATVIDGTSQAGWSANTDTGGGNNANIEIILNGSSCTGCDGLNISASNATIQGLSIHSFAGAGIRVSSGYAQINGNYIGTDPGGMNPFPNGIGVLGAGGQIYVGSGVAERNLITANSGAGIRTTAAATGAFVTNNQIGGRRDGSSGMGNGGAGIETNDLSTHRISANYIRYNGAAGVLINTGSSGEIYGNPSIFGNGGRGIEYVTGGPFPAPNITSYLYDSVSGLTTLTVHMTGAPSSSDQLDVYANASLPSVPEGQQLLASVSGVTFDASGNATVTVPGNAGYATVVLSYCGDGCLSSSEFSTPDFPPQLDILFPTNPIALGSTGSIALQLTNPNKTRTVGSVGYTFTLPSGLTMGAVTAGGDCATGLVFSSTATGVTVSGVTLTPNPSTNMSCTLGATLTPSAGGTYNFPAGTVAVSSDAGQGTNAAASLTVTTVAGITATPNPLNFGTLQVGTSSSLVVNVQSNGTAPLDVTGATVTGAGYAVTGNTCTTGMVAPASCAITVSFTPTTLGALNGQLSITSSAATSPTNVLLTGAGGAPGLQFTPASLAFPSQNVFTTSAGQAVVLQNTGSIALSISSIVAAGDFGYTGCGFPLTLAPGASCTMSVTFTPQANGTSNGSISVTSNAATSPNVLPLTGTGVNGPTPGLLVSPSSLGFGNVRVGSQGTLGVTITSSGSATLALSSITTTGAAFSQMNNCPSSLPVGARCDITVLFTPSSQGPQTGQLVIGSNGSPSTVVVALSGTGVPTLPPALAVDARLDFGQRTVGTTTRLPLDLHNTGEQALNVSALNVDGAVFGVDGSCASIAAGGTCTLAILFSPTDVAAYAGTLRITSNDARGTVPVALSGQGIAAPRPEIAITPDGVGYANQLMTTQSAGQTISIRSVGTAPLHVRGISVAGPFVLTGACPSTLPVGSQCDVSVGFLPIAPGPAGGRLTVDSDAEAGRDFVSLTGTGCRFFSVMGNRILAKPCAP